MPRQIKENREEIESVINRTIFTVAPYFEINFNDNLKRRFPKIVFSEAYINNPFHRGSYDYRTNTIILPYNIGDGNIISHEIGHWFHKIINPRIFREHLILCQKAKKGFNTSKSKDIFIYITESIGFYSELIYSKSVDVLLNPKFDLIGLTKMNLYEGVKLEKELENFYEELFVLCGEKLLTPR